MLKIDALQKYENALLENFSPSVLREMKRSNWNGLLREVDRLYATMYHEWDALQKDVVDLEDAVKSLNWTVNPYTREGEEPGDLAREVAQVVTDALWAKAAHEPGAIGHSFPQLIGALVHHRLRGFNVHQIVWKKAGDLVFPARYIQLPPQFMVWETKAGQPDRLLLVEDGMSANGVPFPPHQYIVALNHNGPDHPLYNATFYSLVNWFVAYKFGLGWFMEYAQKYGMPKQVIRYANEKDRQQIVDDLSDETVLNTVLIKEGQGTGFEMQYPSGGAASLPQAVLVQKAEEACHKAILGQTLTSDTSASGGSLAQAKVHAGVQADVVMKLAEAVADVLNQQLVPAIIQANYGRVQGLPIPELRCKLPQAVASIERAQFLKTALEVPGMKVLKSEAYEYLNLTQPGEDDEVFEAQDPNAQGGPGGPFGGGGFPGMGGGGDKGGEGLPDGDAKDEVVMSSRGVKKNDPAEAWLAPLKKKLAEARSSGASLSELREQIRAWKPDRRALADAMARNIVAGFERGAAAAQGSIKGNTAEEEIAAENPYGCNQHGHGWVDPCPYGGDGSNGMAGKSALQVAGGAENVNPDPDEDEEEKKKKEEAEAKAEEEARKKAEAEQKAKEEAEAEKKELFAAIDEKDKKWGELAEGFRKQLEAMKGLEGTKEYKKAAESLRNIEWYKSSFAHWKGLAENGNEEERLRALQYLTEVKETNSDAEVYEKYAKAGKRAFKALEKVGKEQQEAPKVSKGDSSLNSEVQRYRGEAKKQAEQRNNAIKARKTTAYLNAVEASHEAANKMEAARRRAVGDEAYFKENNDPARALPEDLNSRIDKNPTKLTKVGQKRFAEYIKKCEPVMAIKATVLSRILSDRGGRFVNCWETASGAGSGNVEYAKGRQAVESAFLGIKGGALSTECPVYAFLEEGFDKALNSKGDWYGGLRVAFKEEVRGRCTIAGRDSLNGYEPWDGDPINGVSLLSAPTRGDCLTESQIAHVNNGRNLSELRYLTEDGYMEAQIHGVVTANDVRSIGIPVSMRSAESLAREYREKLSRYNKNVEIERRGYYFVVTVK